MIEQYKNDKTASNQSNKPNWVSTKNRSKQERSSAKQSPSPGLLHHIEMWWADHSDDSYQQCVGIDSLKIVTTLCEAIEGNNAKEHGLRTNE